MPEREFPLEVVLTITTGILLCKVQDVYEILDFMSGDENFTHQLPRVGDECKPYILAQYPELVGITGEGVTAKNYKEWLNEKEIEFGKTRIIQSLPNGAHVSRDPIEEIASMMGGKDLQ